MKGLTEYQKFLLLRPLPPGTSQDSFNNPILNKDDFSDVNWDEVKFTSLCNISTITKNKNRYIPLLFHFDYLLDRIWNDPLKYLAKFSGFLAVPTPDFSTYLNMNIKEVEHNVFRARWIGAWAQYMHYRVLPTCTWGSPKTYDLCFSGIPKGSVVLISTVGCQSHKDAFLDGFAEMKRRISPSLIIVRGKPIEGMTGKFLFVGFKDTFNVKQGWEQMSLFNLDKIVYLEEVV